MVFGGHLQSWGLFGFHRTWSCGLCVGYIGLSLFGGLGDATVVAGVEKAKPGVEMEDADNVRARQAQAQRDQRDRPKFLPSSAKL